MKSKHKFPLLILATAVTGVILFLSARGPRYQGRSLTSWLQECDDTPTMETQRLANAQAAVRAMPIGRVLPRLLALAAAREDAFSPWIMAKSDKFHLRFLEW